ncbi:MAG TPA: hypothetical protein VHC91_14535 [Trinickia sp.]|uniref:hypothetical protein n=1 Tax=Trinickia sp. TaxID=2571163 RepID=UPI002BE199C3|nr:hypothetical protein [Trinickia sp.]HVW51591.1 hypothetical protein [Trinickia sp.]
MEAFSVSSKVFKDAPSTLILFLGSRVPDSEEIDSLFVEWTSKHVVDPVIFIVGERTKIVTFLAESGNADGLDRLTRHSELRFLGYDENGRLHEFASDAAELQADHTSSFQQAVSEFIGQQVVDGDVVIPAPPNFWFEKLSGRYASHFIRAESLLRSTSSIELLALALLAPFHEWWAALNASQRARTTIYIDTMGIWPLAEKLTQMHRCEGRHDTEYIIQSFKSYDGIDDWTPVKRPSFVLISATTSGSLEHKVQQRLEPAAAKVFTVIKLKPEATASTLGSFGNSLHQLQRTLVGMPSFNGLRAEFVPAVTGLPLGDESIQISGERFFSRHAKPRLVRLVYLALDEPTRLALAEFAVNQELTVGKIKFDGRSRWSVSLDSTKTHAALTSQFDQGASLLNNWLRNYAFPGPIAVVYPSAAGTASGDVTKAAKEVATSAADYLNTFPGTNAVVIASDELSASSVSERHLLGERGYVVICPVIGSGFVLKQIAAVLRTLQKSGPRCFLAYAALPESSSQFAQLKQDLSRSADDVSYEFRCKYAFAVGRLEQSLAWETEVEVLSDLCDEVSCQSLPHAQVLSERLESLRNGSGLRSRGVFLPTITGRPLPLSSGFALWPGSEKISGDALAAPVLLTIAALLEATRSANSKTLATTLGKSLFQQALIDPENFTRYNDGVIQAGILRAAYPSELDYRSHPGASMDMARLLRKWIELAAYPAGDAVPEFLLALATGKLRLCPNHERNVLAFAVDSLPVSWVRTLSQIALRRRA